MTIVSSIALKFRIKPYTSVDCFVFTPSSLVLSALNSSRSTVSLSRMNCDTDSSVARLLMAALAVVLTTGLITKHNRHSSITATNAVYSKII